MIQNTYLQNFLNYTKKYGYYFVVDNESCSYEMKSNAMKKVFIKQENLELASSLPLNLPCANSIKTNNKI